MGFTKEEERRINRWLWGMIITAVVVVLSFVIGAGYLVYTLVS